MLPLTPVKISTSKCASCGINIEDTNYKRSVKPSTDIHALLLKYGGINIIDGVICRNCWQKLSRLHTKCEQFYNGCQKNCQPIKRMSNSPAKPLTTPKKVNKRLILSYTPVKNTTYIIDEASNLNLSDVTPDMTLLNISSPPVENIVINNPIHVQSSSSSSIKNHDHSYASSSIKKHCVLTKPMGTAEPPSLDHAYIKSVNKTAKFNDGLKRLSEFSKSTKNEKNLTDTQRSQLIEKLENGTVEDIVKELLKIPTMKNELICEFKNEINSSVILLMQRKNFYISVLRKKEDESLDDFSWWPLIEEMTTKTPMLLHFILSAMITDYDCTIHSELQKKIPRICMMFAIVVQTRDNKLSLLQRLISMLLSDSTCSKKVYDRLNVLGVCLSYDSTDTGIIA